MTPIEQLAKEFSKGNPVTEAAFLAGAKQATLRDIEVLYQTRRFAIDHSGQAFQGGLKFAEEKLRELL